jgi:hypothetical protein
VAFSHSLNRISSKRTGGEATDVWVRVTAGFRKIDGAWVVTHEHVSVPFDMETGKAPIAAGASPRMISGGGVWNSTRSYRETNGLSREKRIWRGRKNSPGGVIK